MKDKEQLVNAIRDNSSETIASIILADIERIEKQEQEIKRLKRRLEEYQEYVEINHKEIERLKNKIEVYKNANEYHQNIIHELETMKPPNQLYGENVRLRSQLQQKENIIKEVREYIEHYETIRGYYEYEEDGYDEYNYEEDLKQELLEILDKAGNSNERNKDNK